MRDENIIGFEKFVMRNKPITKVGFDTGVLVALIDNDKEYNLTKPRFFIKKGICYAYQLAVNQVIGVLMERGYKREDAIRETINFLKENNITIIKEKEIDIGKRNALFDNLKRQRRKLKVTPKPEDSDLDIIASYKCRDIDCIMTTNYKHFIELGKYRECPTHYY